MRGRAKPQAATGGPLNLGLIEYLQILDEPGEMVNPAPIRNCQTPNSCASTARWSSRASSTCACSTCSARAKMGTFAPGLGQEATQIGQVYPLEARDWFAPSYRSLRRADLARLADRAASAPVGWFLRRIRAPPEGVNDLPFSIVIGSHVLPAVGVAQAIQYRGDERSCSPTSATAPVAGRGGRSLQLRRRLSMRRSSSCARTTARRSRCRPKSRPRHRGWRSGLGFGIPAIRVDGNDVLAVVVAVRDAVDRARRRKKAAKWGSDLYRGVDLPHEPAHHGRRPQGLPRGDEVGMGGQVPDHAV